MAYFVSFVCRTTVNGNPVVSPTTLGPFQTTAAACDAANSFQDSCFQAGASVIPSIYGDGQESVVSGGE